MSRSFGSALTAPNAWASRISGKKSGGKPEVSRYPFRMPDMHGRVAAQHAAQIRVVDASNGLPNARRLSFRSTRSGGSASANAFLLISLPFAMPQFAVSLSR